jgi:hypothetical protein
MAFVRIGVTLRPTASNQQGSNQRVDGSFIATILETATVVVIYLAWRSITEGGCCFWCYLCFGASWHNLGVFSLCLAASVDKGMWLTLEAFLGFRYLLVVWLDHGWVVEMTDGRMDG